MQRSFEFNTAATRPSRDRETMPQRNAHMYSCLSQQSSTGLLLVSIFVFIVGVALPMVEAGVVDAAASDSSESFTTANSTTIVLSTTNVPAPMMVDVILAYSVDAPGVHVNLLRLLAADARTAQLNGVTDLSATTNLLPTAVATANPDALMLPLFAYALVPIYNLPDGNGGQLSLRLSRGALARIFSGVIRSWNHTEIQATNVNATLPIRPITVIYTKSASSNIWYRALSKFDATFTQRVTTPTGWSPSLYGGNGAQVATLVATVAKVLTTPYSISWSSLDTAEEGSVSFASLVNSKSVTTVASSTSVAYALSSVGAGPAQKLSATVDIDLTDSDGYGAWPISSYVYIQLSRTRISNSGNCQSRKQLVKFLYFLYTSAIVASIAERRGLSLLPSALYSQLDIKSRLLNLECEGLPVFDEATFAGATSVNTFLAPSDLTFLTTLHLRAFVATNPSYQWQLTTSLSSEQAAMIAPSDLLQEQGVLTEGVASSIELAGSSSSSPRLVQVPLLLVAATPIVNLPAAVVTLFTAANATVQGAHPLFPVRLDMELLASIFTGRVTSWLDPRITAVNPALAHWFSLAVSNPRITIVLPSSTAGGDSQSPPSAASFFTMPVSSTFLHGLFSTQEFKRATGHDRLKDRFPAQPLALLDTLLRLPSSNATVSYVPREDQLSYLTSLVDGSISYAWSTSNQRDTMVEVTVLQGTADVQPTAESMIQCVDWASALDTAESLAGEVPSEASALEALTTLMQLRLKHAADGVSAPRGCWPFTQLRSIFAPAVYATASRSRAMDTMKLVSWLTSEEDLAPSVLNRGAVFLPVAFPMLRQQAVRALQAVRTDDGSSLMTTWPQVWHLSSKVQAACLVLAAIGLAGAIVTCIGLVIHRQHPVIRSASFPFQVMVLCGILALLLGVITLVVPAESTLESCRAWVWLSCFGFSLTFSPIIATVARVNTIFGQRVMKVRRITNSRLSLGVGLVLLADTILLIIWQAVGGGLQPVESLVASTSGSILYKQCGTIGDAASMAPMLLLAASKVAMLLVTAILAYKTRGVEDIFNESRTLSVIIYNTLVVSVLLLPLTIWIAQHGDLVVMLLGIWASWLAYCSLLLALVMKLVKIRWGGPATLGNENVTALTHIQDAKTSPTATSSSSGGGSTSPKAAFEHTLAAGNTRKLATHSSHQLSCAPPNVSELTSSGHSGDENGMIHPKSLKSEKRMSSVAAPAWMPTNDVKREAISTASEHQDITAAPGHIRPRALSYRSSAALPARALHTADELQSMDLNAIEQYRLELENALQAVQQHRLVKSVIVHASPPPHSPTESAAV